MVCLVTIISVFSSYYMYTTSLNAQRVRLLDVVQMQKNVLTELGLRYWSKGKIDEKTIVNILVRSHSLFVKEHGSMIFVVAHRVGDHIRYLSIGGKKVAPDAPLARFPMKNELAIPMKKALSMQVGTIISKDYKNQEVLAAYTYTQLDGQLLGLVAKVDIDEIKQPFMKANGVILGVGTILTLLSVWLFFKISDPILQELHKSEESYRDLVESANSIILRVDQNFVIIFANRFAEEILASPQGTLVGSPFMELFEEQLEMNSLEAIANWLKESTVLSPVSVRTGQGESGWIAWRTHLMKDENEELLCIGTDVTTEHKVRRSQKEIEERFRALAKAAPVGIIITEMQGNLVYANETMHAITKASTVELAGKGWLNFINSPEEAAFRQTWFTNKDIGTRSEFQLRDKENGLHWMLGQTAPLNNSDGMKVGTLITLTDISRIKNAETAQNRLTAAIDQAAEMILITDASGEIQYVNPTFSETTGYDMQEVIGQNPRILHSGEQKTDFYKQMWSTLSAGETWNGRFVNQRKNGERYTQESTIAPIRNEQGECIGYVEVARDISEQLSIEAQLRQSQKLESIGELAAGIAHEINTPTQYVTSNLQFFEDSFKTFDEMADKSFKVLDYIANNGLAEHADELKALVLNITEREEIGFLKEDLPSALNESAQGLKRIADIVQSIKQLAHPGEVTKGLWDLNDIVRDAVTVSTNEWKYCANIQMDLQESLPPIYCLKAEIGQVVLNLIVNAAHAIEEACSGDDQGIITLRTASEEDCVILEVTDTGTGIPQAIIDRIFDPFFTTKDVGKGTGQGLAIAHNVITNLHSGKIEVSSVPGEGSTFRIKIPIEEKDQTTSS